MAINCTVNKKKVSLDIDPNTPLLWALRDHLSLLGTKYGCGIAQCGACTVWVNGEPMRSCVLPISAVSNAQITTIEGLFINFCCDFIFPRLEIFSQGISLKIIINLVFK